MERDIIRKYLDIRETKSGILTEGGKCLYLYGNICCEAKCRRFFLRSEQTEICSEYAEGFLVVRSSDRSSVYHNSKRMLRVKLSGYQPLLRYGLIICFRLSAQKALRFIMVFVYSVDFCCYKI